MPPASPGWHHFHHSRHTSGDEKGIGNGSRENDTLPQSPIGKSAAERRRQIHYLRIGEAAHRPIVLDDADADVRSMRAMIAIRQSKIGINDADEIELRK